MILFILIVMVIADSRGVQLAEENCDPAKLKICVKLTPQISVGLPRNQNELDTHCEAYQSGLLCMDEWISRCPTNGQKLLHEQIGGARTLMRFLCTNDTALRREYLKETTCWGLVTSEWSRCIDEFQLAVRVTTEKAQQVSNFDKGAELCCVRDDFITCVSYTGRSCSSSAELLLRRMAWVLAGDIAACTQRPKADCSATPPSLTSP